MLSEAKHLLRHQNKHNDDASGTEDPSVPFTPFSVPHDEF